MQPEGVDHGIPLIQDESFCKTVRLGIRCLTKLWIGVVPSSRKKRGDAVDFETSEATVDDDVPGRSVADLLIGQVHDQAGRRNWLKLASKAALPLA
jgi:hypothetical protein